MTGPKISVVLPIYNCDDYLEDGLDSILNQTIIDDLEVIMVDDGSLDDSRYIIEKYALDYDNFHAYHKENEGVGITRNYGLELATGEYVMFIDGDDYLMPDTFEKMYNHIVKNGNDFVSCNVSKFTQNTVWKDKIFRNAFKNFTSDVDSTNLQESSELVWDTLSTNKLFRKEFLDENNIRFLDEKVYYEDIIFSFKAHCCADSVGIIKDDCYFWRVRTDDSSITQGIKSITNFKDRFHILSKVQEFIDLNHIEGDVVTSLYMKWLTHDFMMFLRRINDFPSDFHEEFISIVNGLLKRIPDELKGEINGYYQVMYHFVENDDLKNLLKYASVKSDLVEHIENHEVYERFSDEFDFKSGLEYEELLSDILDYRTDDKYIIADFKFTIPFMDKDRLGKLSLKLVDDKNREYDIEYESRGELYEMKIPVDLISEDNKYKIQAVFSTNQGSQMTGYMRSKKRFAFTVNGFEINMGITNDRVCIITSRPVDDNRIIITEGNFNGIDLELKGQCTTKISSLVIEHLIDFYTIEYELEYDNDNEFRVKIPCRDLVSTHIYKWELKPSGIFRSIEIRNMKFFTQDKQILFHNQRNKVIIDIGIYLIDNIINKYENKIRAFRKKQTSLENENKKLKNIIDDYKSSKFSKLMGKFH